ncbi:MAG: arylamine N-acetyltransferase [Bacteroidota bacterium]
MEFARYLQRISYTGPLDPCLEVLSHLQRAHLYHIPFENLDIHSGTPILLDLDRIFTKVVANHRGGFCYELNGLFVELLSFLGFQVKRIAAQVYNPGSGLYGHPYDHLAIVAELEGEEYLTDVGFGEFAQGPLKLETGLIQEDVRGRFRITEENDFLIVQKEIKGEFVPEYTFQNIGRAYQEYASMCSYHQTDPNSHFTQKRLISLPTEKGRITLSGNVLKISQEETVEESILSGEAEFHAMLWKYFRVRLNKPTES